MLLSKIQVQNLWQINLEILNRKNPDSILRSFGIPFMLLIVLLAVKQCSIIVALVVLSIFLFVVLALYITVRYIRENKFRKPYSYNISLISYQIYDFIFLAILAGVFWGVGDDMLLKSNVIDFGAINNLRYYLLLILIMLIVFMFSASPLLTLQKIKRFSTPSETSKSMLYTLMFLNTLPGFFAFIAIMLTRNSENFKGIFVGGVICVLISFFILTFLANSLFEIISLALSEWPKIKRNKLEFVVHYP